MNGRATAVPELLLTFHTLRSYSRLPPPNVNPPQQNHHQANHRSSTHPLRLLTTQCDRATPKERKDHLQENAPPGPLPPLGGGMRPGRHSSCRRTPGKGRYVSKAVYQNKQNYSPIPTKNHKPNSRVGGPTTRHPTNIIDNTTMATFSSQVHFCHLIRPSTFHIKHPAT